MTTQVLDARLNLIKIGERSRKDLGDINLLAASIEQLGLLQPIGIDSNYRLIFGERRLRAFEKLGRETIPARIVHVDSMVQAEHAENEIRKDFTASERVAIAKAIEEEIGNRQGQRTDKPGAELPENFPEVSGQETRQIAAKAAGFGNETTYRQARKVTEEAVPELVEAMDAGEVSISAAAMAAALPEEEQQEIMEEIQQGGKPTEVIKNHVLATKHTGDEESYTPAEYLESARTVMGAIHLDPASNPMAQENVKADKYFTVDDDGLTQEWAGNVWMNPPYTARVINRFIDKLVEHYQAGDVLQAIVLTNNNTDTSWFHQGAKAASAVCFTAGRIHFLKRDGSRSSPTNGQAFLYFGHDLASFKSEFMKHGLVMVKA